jgi:hypothetical protein
MPLGLRPGMTIRDARRLLKTRKTAAKRHALYWNAASCRHEQRLEVKSASMWGLRPRGPFNGCIFHDGLLQQCVTRTVNMSEPTHRVALARLQASLRRRFGRAKRTTRSGDEHTLVYRKGRTTAEVTVSDQSGMETAYVIELTVSTRLPSVGCGVRARPSAALQTHRKRVRQILARLRGRVRRCLRPVGKRRSSSSKPLQLWLRFQLDSFGRPHGVGAGATRAVQGLTCVRQLVARHRFPAGPQPTRIRYPFRLRLEERGRAP